MRRDQALIAASLLLLSLPAAAQHERKIPQGGYDKVGYYMPENDLDNRSQGKRQAEEERSGALMPNPLVIVPTTRAQVTPGTTVYNNNIACLKPTFWSGTTNIFTETFHSGLASSRVLIHYFAQGNVPTTTTGPDGISFICTVAQGTNPSVACPGTGTAPFLVSQTNNKVGMSGTIAYTGTKGINPDMDYTVTISVTSYDATVAAGSNVCGSTLLLQY